MALTSRITLTGPPSSDPEDFLSDSLGVVFPDDVMNQHGDDEHGLMYTSPYLPKPLHISLADARADEDRKLFSHYLWNSSLLLAELIEAGTLGLASTTQTEDTIQAGMITSSQDDANLAAQRRPASHFNMADLSSIELGAGTALPSLLAALMGASRVAVTDYPSQTIMPNLQENVSRNVQPQFSPLNPQRISPTTVAGHEWGKLPEAISTSTHISTSTSTSPPIETTKDTEENRLVTDNKHAFDRVFVCDCLWMPWQHENLQRSISWFLKDDSQARCWVVAGFHTGREKMRGFFDNDSLAQVELEVECMWERECDGTERSWVWDRGVEDVSYRKRWLVVAVLRRPLMESLLSTDGSGIVENTRTT